MGALSFVCLKCLIAVATAVVIGCGGSDSAPGGRVVVAPFAPTMVALTQHQFSAVVPGTTDQRVAWASNAGQIALDGTFTAPIRPGRYIVTATSVADSSKRGSVEVVVTSIGAALRAGGYVVWFRHASATIGVDNPNGPTGWWQRCDSSVARQLDANGETQARAIGAAIRAQSIPIGRVVTSEFCRSRRTAELMALGVTPETSIDITYLQPQYATTGPVQWLQELPRAGTNIFLIAHSQGQSVPMLGPLDQGDAAIFRSEAQGRYSFVARARPSDWSQM